MRESGHLPATLLGDFQPEIQRINLPASKPKQTNKQTVTLKARSGKLRVGRFSADAVTIPIVRVSAPGLGKKTTPKTKPQTKPSSERGAGSPGKAFAFLPPRPARPPSRCWASRRPRLTPPGRVAPLAPSPAASGAGQTLPDPPPPTPPSAPPHGGEACGLALLGTNPTGPLGARPGGRGTPPALTVSPPPPRPSARPPAFSFPATAGGGAQPT